jgi:hypothetical protein
MARWNSLIGLRRRQPKARRSAKLQLERLEERSLLSASPMQEAVSAAINQWDQLLTLVQQDVNKIVQAIDNDMPRRFPTSSVYLTQDSVLLRPPLPLLRQRRRPAATATPATLRRPP